ncbi:MAG TPA: bifunctional diaminohydroxyphosphoribosylaminopyrimidine deaminase/5-amino-6-(5-phosphoribosylamino)uracil reductase RibD [Longimicrobiales bacterium]|nr:bifunctional diaminohydroxyphosphoribosylaminopyrimidine deaminase/5-amino-6-(5-phosphoribosylamino)uracil reductase RibD [Longimicrobiales bacterium]
MTGGADPRDRDFMLRALELARRGWGRVHPNPLVGAVVVREGRVIGEGYHAEYGGPHAEVVALRAAGSAARGATLYVTLEPCNHHGKTPPCTGAILEAGIARVVYGAADPNPRARGGAGTLRAAGVDVVGGVCADESRALNAAFFHVHERGAPFVALKYALSLDARLSEAPGRRTAVTGPSAIAETHRLRAGFDAIMVGSRTARIDDPLLTVRGEVVPRVPPVRVVVDSEAALAPGSRLVRTARQVPVWVLCAEDAPRDRVDSLVREGVRVLPVPRAPAGLDVAAMLDRLAEAGIRSVFCEGGGRLGASLLAADRVRRLYLFYAPRLFGEAGVPAFPAEPGRMAEGWTLREVRPLPPDFLCILDRSG